MEPTLSYIIDLCKQAGEILRDGYGKQHKIQHKGVIDVVTEVDHRSEALLIQDLRRNFPSHTLVTEESGFIQGSNNHCWYIDPLDGTVNYSHSVPIFSVSVAYEEEGQLRFGVVYDPMRDECFSAELGKGAFLNGEPIRVSTTSELVNSLLVTGFSYNIRSEAENNLANFGKFMMRAQAVRRLGSAALDLSYVAAGRFEGYWEMKLSAWDLAAGILICREAGALITGVHGEAEYFKPPYSLLAANPTMHPQILKILNE